MTQIIREIKFRGKRVDNGGWVYGTYHYSADGKYHYILAKEKFIDLEGMPVRYLHMPEVREVLPESVGQYTGLKDRNGREIYERDAVQYLNSIENGKAIVKYQSCTFVFDWLEQNTSSPSIIAESMSYFQCSAELEIIGNTIDNPELIKP
jgi:uncharacterized phage protein (TIGR01671 family)